MFNTVSCVVVNDGGMSTNINCILWHADVLWKFGILVSRYVSRIELGHCIQLPSNAMSRHYYISKPNKTEWNVIMSNILNHHCKPMKSLFPYELFDLNAWSKSCTAEHRSSCFHPFTTSTSKASEVGLKMRYFFITTFKRRRIRYMQPYKVKTSLMDVPFAV